MSAEEQPKHAPYEDVSVGEEVLVRVRQNDDGVLVCEAEFREDTFGGAVDLGGMSSLEQTTAIDTLISGVCSLVWNELLGTPVFDEEDERWWGRVDNARLWERQPRSPTKGWVANDDALARLAEVRANGAAADDVRPEPERVERDPVAATVGDADVSVLRLSQDEMAALMRGEIPDGLVERLLKARSTENLLDSVLEVLSESLDGSEPLRRAHRELAEVRGRFAP